MLVRSVARPIRAAHGARLFILSALVLISLSCSSGGALPPPTPVSCSATRPCPSGLVCVIARGLCALPADVPDLGAEDPDMAMTVGDMASPPDLSGAPADLAMPPDMAMSPVDMAMPPGDMAMSPVDMAMSPVDMAMPVVDMAMSPVDMRIPDMAMPPVDMRMPPADMVMPDMAVPPPPGSEACPAANWCWENPLPQPRDLFAVWGASASDVWAAGARGVALRWNGSEWKQVGTGTTQRLRGVWGRSASQVWLVGDAGTILYWNGLGFAVQASGTTESLAGVWGDGTVVWAVGERGTLLKWSAGSWSKVAIGTTSGLYAIWGSAANDVWAVGEAGVACRFGGISWTCGREFPATSTALAITGTGRSNVWAFGTMSEAWQWNGSTWSARMKPAAPSTVLGATALGTSILAVGLDGAGMLYDGTSWRPLSLGSATSSFAAAWASGASNAYVVGSGGSILRFDGTAARPHSSGFTGTVSAMWGASERDVWVFTLDGLGHHYDGTRWTAVALPAEGYSATGYGSSNLWVGASAGRLMNYDGTRWTITSTRDAAAPIRGIYIASSDRVALLSSSAVQFWDGVRFTISLMPTWLPRAVWGTGPNDIWVAGTPGCPYARWNGATWTAGTVPGCTGGIAAIHGTGATNMYMVSDGPGDSVFRWDGSKFTTVTTGSPAGKTAVFAIGTRTFITTAGGEVLLGSGGSFTTSLSLGSPLGHIAGFAADKVWVGGSSSSYVLSYKP
jgi:hypothetical protein